MTSGGGIDLLKLIDKVSFYCDEPFGDSSILPTMLLSKITREYVKVALSGDGGDETFLGYSKYFFLSKVKKYINSNILKLIVNLLNEDVVYYLNSLLPEPKRQRNIKDRFLKFKRAVNSGSLEEAFFNASRYNDVNVLRAGIFSVANNFKNNLNLGFLKYMSLVDYKNFLKDDVLVKVDRATMSVSLEGREPLLDHRIIEYIARLPIEIKFKNNQRKYLLRQILYKYIPKKLIDKPKSGFQIPLSTWLRNNLKENLNHYINRLDRYIFKVDTIEKVKAEFFKGDDKYSNLMWFLLMYSMWEEKWM